MYIRAVMPHPCAREIRGRGRMALLACSKQIFLHNGRARIVRTFNVVNTVAIHANCLVGLFGGLRFLIQLDGFSMEVIHPGIHDVGIYSVFCHKALISMALAANVGGEQVKAGVLGTDDMMSLVTVDAVGDFSIAFREEGFAVDAFGIEVENFGVAMSARLGCDRFEFVERLCVVGTVTVGTDRCLDHACFPG